MANYVRNVLVINGEEKNVEEVCNFMRSDAQTVDLDKILPTPIFTYPSEAVYWRETAGEVPMPLTVSEIRKTFSHFLQNFHHHLRLLICSPGNFRMWKFPYGGLMRKRVSMKEWLNGQMEKSLMISSLLVTVRLLMIFIIIAGTL